MVVTFPVHILFLCSQHTETAARGSFYFAFDKLHFAIFQLAFFPLAVRNYVWGLETITAVWICLEFQLYLGNFCIAVILLFRYWFHFSLNPLFGGFTACVVSNQILDENTFFLIEITKWFTCSRRSNLRGKKSSY